MTHSTIAAVFGMKKVSIVFTTNTSDLDFPFVCHIFFSDHFGQAITRTQIKSLSLRTQMLLGTHWYGICRMRMTDESHTMLRCQMTPPTRSPAGWLAGRRRSMCHPRRAHCSLSDDLSHSESHDHQNRLSSLLDLSILQSGKCFALACTDLCFLIQIHLLCAFVLFRRQPQSNQQLLC